jgi:hypothetical protein
MLTKGIKKKSILKVGHRSSLIDNIAEYKK